MNILITGANGQLGNELQVALKTTKNVNPIFTDVDTLDITDRDAVETFFTKNKIEFVVNCAAYTAVDKAESDIDLCYAINTKAVSNLSDAAKQYSAKIIHISTDYVFDGSAHKPYIETDYINPQSVYGKSKAEAEQYLTEHNKDNSIIIRTSWLYSKFGNNFVKTMIRLGTEKESLSVIFDQVGTPTNAADLATTIVKIIASNKFVAGIYHFSNEGVCSWYDFAKAIFDIKNLNCSLSPIETKDYPTPAKRPHYSILNKTKIKETFGIKIPHWYDSLLTVIGTI